MTLRTLPRVFLPAVSFALAVTLALGLGAPAAAGTLKGTVKMPVASRSTRLYQGYWRLENGNVPVSNTGGAKMETVVVLDKVNGAHPPPARTVTVEMGGLDAHPRMVVSGPGSVVEIKNTGKVRLDLSTPETPSVMPLEQLPPGATRRVKFDAPGGYAIHDAEYPHILISVIIVDSPFFSTIDEKGSFSIAGAPDGKAHLKVWTRGRWAAEQEVDTGSKDELVVNVAAPGAKDEKEKEPAE
ncbi:MAG TPA: hypothetical protein VHO06_02380 [Polyangia bacterium]|nr:hypothetical protein [Polyangia bacterium]